jgi:hypothetical protein
VMVAGGIAQVDIARARGISALTLRKHYRAELTNGMTALNTIVLIGHVKRIKAGDFQAIKWWQQARMGWSERVVVDDGKPPDTPMRVIVEFVGEAAPSRVEQSAPRSGSRFGHSTGAGSGVRGAAGKQAAGCSEGFIDAGLVDRGVQSRRRRRTCSVIVSHSTISRLRKKCRLSTFRMIRLSAAPVYRSRRRSWPSGCPSESCQNSVRQRSTRSCRQRQRGGRRQR